MELYTELLIKKVGDSFLYIPNGQTLGFGISKGYLTWNETSQNMQIVEEGRSLRPKVKLENITVQVEDGALETFTTFNDFENRLIALKNPLVNFNSGGATSPKQYKFLLTQSGGDDPQTITSGTLTQGVTYEILAGTDADFTLSGAPNNTIGTKWIANNIAPDWGSDGELGYNNGAPFVVGEIVPNSLGGGIWFYTSGTGQWRIGSLDLFTENKTSIEIEPLPSRDKYGFAVIDNKSTFELQFSTLQSDFLTPIPTPANDLLYFTAITITVG